MAEETEGGAQAMKQKGTVDVTRGLGCRLGAQRSVKESRRAPPTLSRFSGGSGCLVGLCRGKGPFIGQSCDGRRPTASAASGSGRSPSVWRCAMLSAP